MRFNKRKCGVLCLWLCWRNNHMHRYRSGDDLLERNTEEKDLGILVNNSSVPCWPRKPMVSQGALKRAWTVDQGRWSFASTLPQFFTLSCAPILSLEDVVFKCWPALPGLFAFQRSSPWDTSKYVFEEVSPTYCFASSTQDSELHHLIIAASQVTPNLHIPSQPFLLSKNKVQQYASSRWLLQIAGNVASMWKMLLS